MSTEVTLALIAAGSAAVATYQAIRVTRIKAETERQIEVIRAQSARSIERFKIEQSEALRKLQAEDERSKIIEAAAIKDYEAARERLNISWRLLQQVKDTITASLREVPGMMPSTTTKLNELASHIESEYLETNLQILHFEKNWCPDGKDEDLEEAARSCHDAKRISHRVAEYVIMLARNSDCLDQKREDNRLKRARTYMRSLRKLLTTRQSAIMTGKQRLAIWFVSSIRDHRP